MGKEGKGRKQEEERAETRALRHSCFALGFEWLLNATVHKPWNSEIKQLHLFFRSIHFSSENVHFYFLPSWCCLSCIWFWCNPVQVFVSVDAALLQIWRGCFYCTVYPTASLSNSVKFCLEITTTVRDHRPRLSIPSAGSGSYFIMGTGPVRFTYSNIFSLTSIQDVLILTSQRATHNVPNFLNGL